MVMENCDGDEWPVYDKPILPYSRGPKILKLLYEHGPMPISVIGSLLDPPMNPRRTRDAMWSLRAEGLVIARHAANPNWQPAFFQLTAREKYRKKIADTLKIPEEKLRDLRVRDQEIFHSIDCARWAEHLKRKFPDAKVLRENRLHVDSNAKDALNIEFDHFELKPDILLLIPRPNEARPLSIAFEIERSRKSPKRIERKLRNFAQATWCDGIIYATNDTGIQELVRKIWVNRNLHRGTSVHGYPNNYLMFTVNVQDWLRNGLRMWNAKNEVTWIDDWMKVLCAHRRKERLDSHFKPPAEGG